mgnify:CR=1 FL=1
MSYKKVLITGSKNLLSIPAIQGVPSNTAFSNDTKRTWTAGTYVVGLTRSNYYAPNNVSSYSVTKTTVSFTTTTGGYGIAIPVKLEAGKSYTLSANPRTGYFGQTFYKEDGTMISFSGSSTFTVPAGTVWTTIVLGADAGKEVIFSNIQLEEGTTATDFAPPYCESYKKVLIQSSNPIQLLNPTKFQTLTLSGVSFVSNNGVITANGTATAAIYFAVQTIAMSIVSGHKMLITGCPSGGSWSGYCLYDSGDSTHGVDFGSGAIYPVTVDRSTYIYIYIAKGYVVTNLQFKPRFYDLTATFGAGNEPTTIAAFRAKFPNEVYPYNPSYCLSPKSALITPTKNLFNLASANSVSVKNGYWIQTAGIYAPTGYFYELDVTAGEQYTVSYDLYTTGGHDALAISVQTGKGYLPVADSGKRLTIGINGYDSKKAFARHVQKFTIPGGVTHIYFTGSNNGNFRNFQIEKGNIAVADIQYVPYNYI